MGYFEQILDNPLMIIFSVILVLYAIREGHNFYIWIRGRFDDYHTNASSRESVRKQLSDISGTSKEHTDALVRLTRSVDELRNEIKGMKTAMDERFNDAEKERKFDIQATARAAMYDIYEKIKDKDTVSSTEYETFHELAQRYLEAGGNSVFKNKIIPEVEGKSVQD